MKDSAWYNKLWQNKMQDLPLEGDANSAWEKMNGLLDENMPVTSSAPKVKNPGHFPGSGFLPAIGGIIVAFSIIYLAYYFIAIHPHKQDKRYIGHIKQLDSVTQVENKTNSAGNRIRAIEQNSIKMNDSATAAAGEADSATYAGNKVLKATKNAGAPAKINNDVATTGIGDNAATSASNKVKNAGGSAKTNNNTTIVGAIEHNVAASAGSKVLKNTKNAGASPKINNDVNAAISAHSALVSYRQHKNNHLIKNNHRKGIFSTPGAHYSTTAGNRHKNHTAIRGGSNSTDKNQNNQAAPGSNSQPENKDNTTSSAGKTTDSASLTTKNVPAGTAKNNGTASTPDKPATKQPVNTVKAKDTKAQHSKKETSSGFELEIKAGLSTNKNSAAAPFLGIAGSYAITPKLSVGIGANVLSHRNIAGSYSKSNYNYTTVGDSGKITNHTADKLVVQSSGNLYTVDIPVLLAYKVNNWLSFNVGPVISIPLKTGSIKSVLSPFSNPVDTLSAYKDILSAANSTTIKNKVNFNFSAGATLNFGRININAGYMQSLSPYTISSSLGKTSTNYHTFQIGIGYVLFKPKKKK